MNKRFKILSIDGGGIRGVIPAQILAELEAKAMEQDGKEARLSDYFDLVAGTSTGGIIALGIALGIKVSEILNLYLKHGEVIFPRFYQTWLSKIANIVLRRPFYQRENLSELLEKTYGYDAANQPRRIGHCKTRVLIPTYNLAERKINVLKTPHHSSYTRDYQIPAFHAALATASAPVYFSPHDFSYTHLDGEFSYSYCSIVDGGLVANNPSFMAVMEARTKLGIPLDEMSLLSVGTGSSLKKVPEKSSKITPLFWINPLKGPMLYEIMSEAQADNINNELLLLSQLSSDVNPAMAFQYVRLQPSFEGAKTIELDSTSKRNFDRMKSAGSRIFQDASTRVVAHFLQEKKQEYKPSKSL